MNVVRNIVTTVAFAALCAGSAVAQDQAAPAKAGPPVLAKNIVTARAGGMKMMVTSSSFASGDALPERYTQFGDNMSPSIVWSKGPSGTLSYVLLAEDSGVNRAEPIVHWIVYDLPSTSDRLSQGIPAGPKLENGAGQGKNVRGEAGYLGPKPPAGQTHPYHFQVFALNARLNIDPATADRATVLNAMKGKVLASGDIVGMVTGK